MLWIRCLASAIKGVSVVVWNLGFSGTLSLKVGPYNLQDLPLIKSIELLLLFWECIAYNRSSIDYAVGVEYNTGSS